MALGGVSSPSDDDMFQPQPKPAAAKPKPKAKQKAKAKASAASKVGNEDRAFNRGYIWEAGDRTIEVTPKKDEAGLKAVSLVERGWEQER